MHPSRTWDAKERTRPLFTPEGLQSRHRTFEITMLHNKHNLKDAGHRRERHAPDDTTLPQLRAHYRKL